MEKPIAEKLFSEKTVFVGVTIYLKKSFLVTFSVASVLPLVGEK